jgi:hypothetical protein
MEGQTKQTPVDIREIELDMSLPKKERVKSYIEQAGTPYCVRVGNVVVEMVYNDQGGTMQSCMESSLEWMG